MGLPAGLQAGLTAPSTREEPAEDSASAELAAAIAAMLVAVAPAVAAPADAGNAGDGGALQSVDADSTAAAPDAALNRLLQSLTQRLSATKPEVTASATQPGDSALLPLLSPARTAEAAAAALVAAARQPELLPPAETPAQPSAQSLASSLASTMGPVPQSQAAVAVARTPCMPQWARRAGRRNWVRAWC